MNKLSALRYHDSITTWLRTEEGGVWDWFAAPKLQDEQDEETRGQLLKETYRLSRDAYEHAYTCCEMAMRKLGIDAPVTLYQASDGAMNAALFFVPGEVHIVLYGPVLDKLNESELTALFGHEVAHYLLWTMQDRQYRITQQIIDDSVAQAGTNDALYETARLFHLNTEIFADRGAVLAAGGAEPAIAVLVKVMTGLAATDPASFLQQASELDAKGEISNAVSHPEMYLRALFIDKWHRGEDGIDDWITEKLKGPMAIGNFDVLDQQELGKMTEQFFNRFLHNSDLASEMVVTQVKQFFPGWDGGSIMINDDAIKNDTLDKSIRDYFIALIFDLAHADPDQTEEMLVKGAGFAAGIGWSDAYRDNLKSILKLRKPQIDRIFRASIKKEMGAAK